MAHNRIRTAAFVPADGLASLPLDLYTLRFPADWREAVLDFHVQIRPESKQSRTREYGTVPIRRLNQLLRAVAPGLVSVGPRAPVRTGEPWLYSEQPFDPEMMSRYVDVWLDDLAPREKGTGQAVAAAYQPMLAALQRMDRSQLTWENDTVDLLGGETNGAGTQAPHRVLYRLLPEYAASRVAAAGPYEFGGRWVHWHRSASHYDGAELVSDVLSYTPKGRKHTGKPWYYSGYLRFYLRTEEFSPVPRLYLACGIKRWISGKAKFQANRDISAYLLADETLLPKAPTPGRYAVADLRRVSGSDRVEWRLCRSMEMLRKLAFTDHFPDPDVLAKDATSALEEGRGPRIALTHHTTMGHHAVLPGVMPEERRRLTEWVAGVLAPNLVPEPELGRVTLPRTVIAQERVLENPKGSDEEKQGATRRNAERRRAQVAAALQGNELSVLVLHQNPDMRDRLIGAAEESLALADHRADQGPHTWSWNAPDLTVRLTTREVGALASPLGGEETPKRGAEFESVTAERRALVRTTTQDIIAASGVQANLAFVELDGRKTSTGKLIFSPRRDPKDAIRAGCAEAGMVSQFIRPLDPEVPVKTRKGKTTGPEDEARHRAAFSWSDGLRQLGATLVPRVAQGGTIPDDLAQIAFWMVRRNVTSGNPLPQFTPVALLSEGEGPVLGRTPAHDGWVPYPQLLRDLTGRISEREERTLEQQTSLVGAFVRSTLQRFRTKNTLVVAQAQNARKQWPWLGNGRIELDRVALGEGRPQRLAMLGGRRMRIVRVTSADRNETPQWWAPVDDGAAGFTKGLWRSELDPTGRIFHSVGEKPSTAQKSKEIAKLTPHTVVGKNKEGESVERNMHDPSADARTPQLLRFAMAGLLPEDDPAAWAMFLHMQRTGDDYRDDLALPALLHLASLTNEYALPYEVNQDEDEDEGWDGKPGQMSLF